MSTHIFQSSLPHAPVGHPCSTEGYTLDIKVRWEPVTLRNFEDDVIKGGGPPPKPPTNPPKSFTLCDCWIFIQECPPALNVGGRLFD